MTRTTTITITTPTTTRTTTTRTFIRRTTTTTTRRSSSVSGGIDDGDDDDDAVRLSELIDRRRFSAPGGGEARRRGGPARVMGPVLSSSSRWNRRARRAGSDRAGAVSERRRGARSSSVHGARITITITTITTKTTKMIITKKRRYRGQMRSPVGRLSQEDVITVVILAVSIDFERSSRTAVHTEFEHVPNFDIGDRLIAEKNTQVRSRAGRRGCCYFQPSEN